MTLATKPAFEGPEIDDATREHRYITHGERDIEFEVIPEGRGWAVRIEGIPEPSIVHDEPWSTVDSARDAALRAVRAINTLEYMQRRDREGGA